MDGPRDTGSGGLHFRPYSDDLNLVRDFLSACALSSRTGSYWHPGDFVWCMYQNSESDPEERVGIWTDVSGTAGVAILDEPDCVVMQVRPDLRGDRTVEAEMLRWVASRLPEIHEKLSTMVVEQPGGDDAVSGYLRAAGFTREPGHYLIMHQRLADLPENPSPEGWNVRQVFGEEEWERRVDLHREVWNSSRVTVDAYSTMRVVPGYDPDLDLVAVNAGGAFGSYCICWYDPGSRTGIFEPVGTAERFRRKGLGRAVMGEGLARLRELGAESALVLSAEGNDASRLLYESVGFEGVAAEYTYSRNLEGLDAALR